MGHAARAELESLLRARKLDVTVTSTGLWAGTARDVAPTGIPGVDEPLGGGVARGQLSEIVGARSSGRTTVLCGMLAASAERGEAVALVDPCDRFDPSSAAAAGLDLSKLLWVRLSTGDAPRAVKAMNLVLQAGGFGVVALDLAGVPPRDVRQVPLTTWMRIARVIEGSQTVAVIAAAERVARSPGGVTIALDAPAGVPRGCWSGTADRARLLRGLDLQPRVIGRHRC